MTDTKSMNETHEQGACPECKGSGSDFSDRYPDFLSCPTCRGSGMANAALIAAADKHADDYEGQSIPANEVRAAIRNAFVAGYAAPGATVTSDAHIVRKATCVTVVQHGCTVGSFSGPDCEQHAALFLRALGLPVARTAMCSDGCAEQALGGTQCARDCAVAHGVGAVHPVQVGWCWKYGDTEHHNWIVSDLLPAPHEKVYRLQPVYALGVLGTSDDQPKEPK